MTTQEAYQLQLERLTEAQKLELNLREKNKGRKYLPWEINEVFKLGPFKKEEPRKRRMSDEVEQHWSEGGDLNVI